ncbi:MAG TPA: M14 family zinc carboxypeptidase, partial [Bacillota bacterium]|nr:M14 family zinc carboxypeptidase [Bacillota bacterium]
MIHFSFALLEKQLTELKQQYAFLETGVAGNSVMGNNLYYVRLGKGPYRVFYNGAHHANEWITAMLLIRFISNYTAAYQSKKTLGGYNLQDLFNQSSIYIVPLVNPDGVDLVTHHPNYPRPVYQAAASLNTTGLPLPKVWKANLRGVDLNLNYPALWELEKR